MTPTINLVMEIAASLGKVERWKVSNRRRQGLRLVKMWVRESIPYEPAKNNVKSEKKFWERAMAYAVKHVKRS